MSSSKDKLWWEIQKNGGWKTLTNSLSRSSKVHKIFDNFIKIFYWKFRNKKGIPLGTYNPEINFQGFREFLTDEEGEMGHCSSKKNIIIRNGRKIYNQTMSIALIQLYLLDKLGMNKFITSYSSKSTWSKDVSSNSLIGTIAHELAHAYQNTINMKEEMQSQCESSGKKDKKGNFLYPKLVFEHTQLTKEIEKMIINSSEYQEFKKWWVKKSSSQVWNEPTDDNDEFTRLILLIENSEDLTTLESNYQSLKNNPYYNISDNKTKLDNAYNVAKSCLQHQTSQNDHLLKGDGKELLLFLAIIGVIVIILLIFFDQKKRKKR